MAVYFAIFFYEYNVLFARMKQNASGHTLPRVWLHNQAAVKKSIFMSAGSILQNAPDIFSFALFTSYGILHTSAC